MRTIWKKIASLLLTILLLLWVGLLVVIATFVEPMWDKNRRR